MLFRSPEATATTEAIAAEIATDIAGQKRDRKVPPVPGAWADLKPGENTFWMPRPDSQKNVKF